MVSVFPCAIHGKRINGALESIRINVYSDSGKYTRYLRVCPVDLTELIRAAADQWTVVDDNEMAIDEDVCAACRKAQRRAGAYNYLSAYVFRRGQDRQDFFAQYCDRCIADVVKTYSLEKEELT